MSKRNQQRIKSHRETAYFAQHGRCYYCTAPMWLYVPEELTEPLGVKPGQAMRLQCTAEHLVARSDGGPDTVVNIVAACLYCNQARHKPKVALTPADRRQGSIKSFAFELGNAERVGVSLPTQLRQRQWVMARVAHVLRWPPEKRAHFSSWSAASIKRLASMRSWPDGVLTWICPPAAELVRQQDSLRRELSISPRYFKAYAALLDSIR